MKREAQSRWNIMKSINDDENRLKKIGIELQDEDEIIKKLFVFATKLFKIFHKLTTLNHFWSKFVFCLCKKE